MILKMKQIIYKIPIKDVIVLIDVFKPQILVEDIKIYGHIYMGYENIIM